MAKTDLTTSETPKAAQDIPLPTLPVEQQTSGADGNESSGTPAVEQEQSQTQTGQPQRQTMEQLLAQEREKIRREMQSQKDRELHTLQLRWQQEQAMRQQQEAERARLSEMDDADYGRYLREQEKKQVELQQQQVQWITPIYEEIQRNILAALPDDETRAEMNRRVAAREFQTLTDFQTAAIALGAEATLKKKLSTVERQAREAALKEQTSQEVDAAITPTLGAGRVAPSGRKLTPEQLISEGFAERIRKQRGGR